jgi:hypothetical protein
MLSYFEPGIRPYEPDPAADLHDKIYQRFLRTIGTDLPKDGRAERVVFEIRYRPDESFEKDYILYVIVPELE